MATNNQVNVGLSGSTGTGNFVGTTSPTLVTPTLGAATGASLTFSPTTGGIVGTTTNDNTNAGNSGEYIQSTILSASAITLTTNTAADITSISLTAGDWDLTGNVVFIFGATTNCTTYGVWSSATSATAPDVSLSCNASTAGAGTVLGAITGCGTTIPYARYSLSGTMTIYLSTKATFTLSTLKAFGRIEARRAR